DSKQKDTMAKDGMNDDSMAPTMLTLAGSPVDIRKHLGHTVTVIGSPAHAKMDAMEKSTMDKAAPTFTVKPLKVVAATCSWSGAPRRAAFGGLEAGHRTSARRARCRHRS